MTIKTFVKNIFNGYRRYFIIKNLYLKKPQLLTILFYPDGRLNTPSETVTKITKETHNIFDSMLYTMYKNKGIGLSAVQLGIFQKLVVIDTNPTKTRRELIDMNQPLCMINPEILHFSEEKRMKIESCLSCPRHIKSVKRSKSVKVKYLDRAGVEKILEVDDEVLARVIQHEVEHTQGIVLPTRTT